MKRVDKTRLYTSGVKNTLNIHKFLLSYRMGFNAFSSLIMIVNTFNKLNTYSTYTGVYDHLYSERNGGNQVNAKRAINKMVKKGLVKADTSSTPIRLYPTERALKEVSKFL